MEREYFRIGFADLIIDFHSEFPMAVPMELEPFLCEGGCPTDSYEICIFREPLVAQGERLYTRSGLSVYREPQGTFMLYGNEDSGDIVFGCRMRHSGQHTIYVQENAGKHMAFGSRLGGIMNGEELLLRHNAIVLHSSLVSYGGKGILFSGPSGIGKSTQAELWRKNLGAEILNGDRAVIRLTQEGFRAGGSPWCGSSGIYRQEYIPVNAIVLLRQGKENRILPAEPKVAFREIYSQCIVHDWDKLFVDRICDLVQELVRQIPIYILSCVPEASAAILTEQTVFQRTDIE